MLQLLIRSALVKLIVLGFNDTSALVGHFVLSPRERERRDSRGDEREGQDSRPCQTVSQYQLDASVI